MSGQAITPGKRQVIYSAAARTIGRHRRSPVLLSGDDLLDRAKALLRTLRNQARRAFVLEITGTPKSGKSTAVATLQTFFKQAGYQVHLLRERAADCPLPMKGHFFFNAWTTATMLAEVLETHETNVDLLILDRGFFDALIWLELQSRRGQVTAKERKAFAEFVLLERWRSLVDATVVMTVQPTVALRREHESQIVPRTGSMMNPDALADFNDALKGVEREYSDLFSLISIDTTNTRSVVKTNTGLVAQLLPRIENWADPRIAVVPKDAVGQLFGTRPYLHGEDARKGLAQLRRVVSVLKRSKAEEDSHVVQMIAAGVHVHRDRIVVLEREQEAKKTVSYGRRTLWIGCHVELGARGLLASAIACLERRIQQDLHLSTHPNVELLGLAWDQAQPENQHVGVMFRAPISDAYVADHLKNKQFKKMGRPGQLVSVSMTQEEIITKLEQLDLEPWSKYMAHNIKLTKEESS